jgi:hypothetical protein
MLSADEKLSLDRLAFCMHITRSGILANIVAEFVMAAEDSRQGRQAQKALQAYLEDCRQAVKKRGAFAAKCVVPQ